MTLYAQQGVRFLDISFEEILKQAKNEDKLVFIDVYADWCGPCKFMDKETFSQKEVGAYFNKNFVAYKMNAEDVANKEFLEKYKIKGLPTLLILDKDEKILHAHTGAVDAYGLIRLAKKQLGELKSPDQLYKEYKKKKKNFEKMKAFLLDAPYFIREVGSVSQQKKWGYRVNKVFDEYIKNKDLDNMINVDDFRIITTFHVQMDDENDRIVNSMVKYYDDYTAILPEEVLSNYISRLHLEQIYKMARQGNEKYKRELNRIKGDMAQVYMFLYPDLEGFYDTYSKYAEAGYEIFYKKDSKAYIACMEDYFKYIPDPNYNDYAQAIENLINGLDEKIDKHAAVKSIEWIEKAMAEKHNEESSVSLQAVLGDCLLALNKKKEAQEAYNKAYLILLKSKNQNFVGQMQQVLKKKIEGLK